MGGKLSVPATASAGYQICVLCCGDDRIFCRWKNPLQNHHYYFPVFRTVPTLPAPCLNLRTAKPLQQKSPFFLQPKMLPCTSPVVSAQCGHLDLWKFSVGAATQNSYLPTASSLSCFIQRLSDGMRQQRFVGSSVLIQTLGSHIFKAWDSLCGSPSRCNSSRGQAACLGIGLPHGGLQRPWHGHKNVPTLEDFHCSAFDIPGLGDILEVQKW